MKPADFRLICFFLFLPAFSFAQNTDGLVARYYFNNGNAANDAGPSPAKAVGVAFGEDRFGNSQSACCLFGNDKSYLNLGTGSILKPSAGSISIWIKMIREVYSGHGYRANPIVLTKNNHQDYFFEAYGIAYDTKSKKITAACTLSDLNQIVVVANNNLKLGEWYHIVITYDDKSLCLYIDGVLQNCAAKNFHTVFLQTDSVMIGNSANVENNRFFDGYIDDISIYNKVLSQEEVAKLYNEPDPNRYHIILKIFLISLLSLIGISGIVTIATRKFRKELQKEKEKNKLQRQLFDMEMKVTKAQMNPHFIFNSMNSIQQFILADDTENANTYLVKFARLLRKILESNTDEFVSLENEMDILNKYIEIESLRFAHAFNYKIKIDDKLNGSNIRIPQMLIQPFVENAIWHGLLPKEGEKNLVISIDYVNKVLLSCTIEDNGVGRHAVKSAANVLKGKSLGIQFIQQRLDLMKNEWGGDYGIEITDRKDENGQSAGTCVIIKIPIVKD
jgi:hypothetical protein